MRSQSIAGQHPLMMGLVMSISSMNLKTTKSLFMISLSVFLSREYIHNLTMRSLPLPSTPALAGHLMSQARLANGQSTTHLAL